MIGADRRELAHVLRRLAEWEVRDEGDLALWYDVARAVNEWLAAPRSVSVPRVLWAWLAEADRRLADPEYARAQDGFIWDYIRDLESR
jgi:transglutaminase-like putative cysteine protease